MKSSDRLLISSGIKESSLHESEMQMLHFTQWGRGNNLGLTAQKRNINSLGTQTATHTRKFVVNSK